MTRLRRAPGRRRLPRRLGHGTERRGPRRIEAPRCLEGSTPTRPDPHPPGREPPGGGRRRARLLLGNASGKMTTLKTVLGIVRPRTARPPSTVSRSRTARRATASAGDRGPGEPEALRPDDGPRAPGDGRVTARRRPPGGRQRLYSLFPLRHQPRTQLAGTLSGGEQQMVAMGERSWRARSSCSWTSLRWGSRRSSCEDNFEIIEQVHEEGVATLVVEQNANVALSIADRGYVLSTGRIVLEGKAAELIDTTSCARPTLPLGPVRGLTPGHVAAGELPILEHATYADSCSQGAFAQCARRPKNSWTGGREGRRMGVLGRAQRGGASGVCRASMRPARRSPQTTSSRRQ